MIIGKPTLPYKGRMDHADDLWLIWSNKSGCWYKDKSQGYTADLDKAGVFSKEEAATHYEPDAPVRDRVTEPFPVSAIRKHLDKCYEAEEKRHREVLEGLARLGRRFPGKVPPAPPTDRIYLSRMPGENFDAFFPGVSLELRARMMESVREHARHARNNGYPSLVTFKADLFETHITVFGSGEVALERKHTRKAPPARVVGRPEAGEIVCPNCDGAGQFEASTPGPIPQCNLCDGTGVVDPLEKARAMVTAIEDLIGSSGGVYGLHLNGDPAPWDSLLPEGQYGEWLQPFSDAQDVLLHPRCTGSET